MRFRRNAIHIVTEIQEDQTSVLALVPRGGTQRSAISHKQGGASSAVCSNAVSMPDFINTQAIKARALAMALAYPQIERAVSELFYDFSNTADSLPEIDIIFVEGPWVSLLQRPQTERAASITRNPSVTTVQN